MYIQSISQTIAPLLHRADLEATVESAFAEACNLVTADGERFSLVSAAVGNGPLNAVVNPAAALSLLRQHQRVDGNGRFLTLSAGYHLDLTQAEVWDPVPQYERLAAWPQVVVRNLNWLRETLPLDAPSASLAAAPAYHTQGAFGSRPAMALIQSQASDLVDGLMRAYYEGDLRWLMIFAGRLAGLGPGLTPAGDDWLVGWMVGLRAREALNEGQPGISVLTTEMVNKAILQAVARETTALSLAFLEAAAIGAVPQVWHDLIDALTNADSMPLRKATTNILRQGATSGADMLAGFLAAFDPD